MMSDFSDKYSSALDEIAISPDFKERTAEKMAQIRDAQSRSRIVHISRWVSGAAAAAACIAVLIAVNRSGVFEENIPTAEPNGTLSGGAAEISTEIGADLGWTVAETAAPAADIDIKDDDIEADDDTIEYENDEIAEDDIAEEILDEEPAALEAEVREPVIMEPAAPVTTEAAQQEDIPESVGESAPMAVPEEESDPIPTPQPRISVDENDVSEYGFISGEAVYVPPVAGSGTQSTQTYEDAGSADGEGEGISGEGDTIEDEMEEAPAAPAAPDSAAVKKPDFSAAQALSVFDADVSLTVTPVFEEYSEEEGRVISRGPVSVSDGERVRQLVDSIAAFTEGKSGTSRTSPQSGHRYIIDLADDQGSRLRIYTGNSSICFMAFDDSGAVYFVYPLDNEERERLEAEIGEYFE